MALAQTKVGVQTMISCSRLVARAFVATVHPSTLCSQPAIKRTTHFVSALSGFPKDLRYGPSTVLRKDGFGDDACFIARHRLADVVGKYLLKLEVFGIFFFNFSFEFQASPTALVVGVPTALILRFFPEV